LDEQELLQRVEVDANVNIGLLKDLFHDESFRALVMGGKIMDAVLQIRSASPAVGLREARMAVEAFSAAWK
jgi:hypothetical protein